MRKFVLWGCLALVLFSALIYTGRPGGPHQVILGTWYTGNSEVGCFTLLSGPEFEDDAQGTLVKHWTGGRRASNETLDYKFVDRNHIELSDWRGPTGERWTVQFLDSKTLIVSGAWGAIDRCVRDPDDYNVGESVSRLDRLKKFARRLIGK